MENEMINVDEKTIRALLAYIDLQSVYITDDYSDEMETESCNQKEIADYEQALVVLRTNHNMTI
jgi:hypothetical protein